MGYIGFLEGLWGDVELYRVEGNCVPVIIAVRLQL